MRTGLTCSHFLLGELFASRRIDYFVHFGQIMTASTVNCFDRGLKRPPTLLMSVASTWREGLVRIISEARTDRLRAVTLFWVSSVVVEDTGEGSSLFSCVF